MRGATSGSSRGLTARIYFNPRAPCGARLTQDDPGKIADLFQSTRPMRGATHQWLIATGEAEFQSTRPMRGATRDILNGLAIVWAFQSTRPMRGATSTAFKLLAVV